jgi:ABC-2 type transport system permease protein
LFYHDHLGPDKQLTDAAYEAALARNEREYARYFNLPQPRLAKANLDLDLYPDDLRFEVRGTLWFVNKVNRPLDTILLAASLKEEGRYTVRNPHVIIADDKALKFRILHLITPLQKGDTLTLDVEVRNKRNGPLKANDRVKANGTYLLGFHILPGLGVRNAFLADAGKRAKHGLGDRQAAPLLPSDTTLLGYAFPANNMGRIDFETTISTSADQQAFSLGERVREWKEGNRNYFHYRSGRPVTNNIAWLAGRYQTERDTAGDLPLEFYYLPGHGQNIGHIRHGIRAGIGYCSAVFGPLEHESLKMVEFPNSYGSHATLNGNLIPYSERMLLCDVDHENNEVFNVPFFTGAHEVAHYWWGHRVDPANVAGSRFITEGMADYLAIKITEREYGPAFSREVLKLFQELYLRDRAREANEVPLVLAGLEQKYLNYRKASLAFNALSHYLGENTFNQAAAGLEERFRFAPPPFATSYDLVAAFKEVTPDSLLYLIEDYFENITLYDNSLGDVQIDALPEGDFQARITLFASKYRSDAKGTKTFTDDKEQSLREGKRQSLPLADYLELAFYKDGRELAVKRVRTDNIRQTFTFRIPEFPDRVELDPNYLLLDANHEDGIWRKPTNL